LLCKKTPVKTEDTTGSFGSLVADYKERLTEIRITPERVAKVKMCFFFFEEKYLLKG
jgi:hypothetical protein